MGGSGGEAPRKIFAFILKQMWGKVGVRGWSPRKHFAFFALILKKMWGKVVVRGPKPPEKILHFLHLFCKERFYHQKKTTLPLNVIFLYAFCTKLLLRNWWKWGFLGVAPNILSNVPSICMFRAFYHVWNKFWDLSINGEKSQSWYSDHHNILASVLPFLCLPLLWTNSCFYSSVNPMFTVSCTPDY